MRAELTIIMPSWNKERYIAEALDSVFKQETSRAYRVLVADDHSTDQTLKVVEEYSQRHPGTIDILRSDSNQKLFRNVRRAYAVCKTPYFCVLDPDDYWCDPHHLEKALSFLSTHPNHTIYSAGIEMLHPDGHRERVLFPLEEKTSSWKDYLNHRATVAFTQTCVYRNVVFAKGLPKKMTNPPFATMEKTYRGDSFRNFLHIREGLAYFSPSVEGCYRITDEGVYQGLGVSGQLLLNAQFFADIWRYDDGKFMTFLLRSRDFFQKAVANLPAALAAYRGNVEKLHVVGEEMEALRRLYAGKDPQLRTCALRSMSLKRRLCYAAYLYLLKRKVVVEA